MSGLSSAFPQPARFTAGANIADAISRMGASFYASDGLSGVATALAAASNVNGAVLRTASCNSNGSTVATLFIDPVAPTAWNNFVRRPVWSQNTTGSYGGMSWQMPLFVPAGSGIFWATSGATIVMCSWDLL